MSLTSFQFGGVLAGGEASEAKVCDLAKMGLLRKDILDMLERLHTRVCESVATFLLVPCPCLDVPKLPKKLFQSLAHVQFCNPLYMQRLADAAYSMNPPALAATDVGLAGYDVTRSTGA
eukprot:scaffold210131_cov21-Tisochrysis_lutea.AAC.1